MKKHYLLYILLIFFAFKDTVFGYGWSVTVPDTGEGGEEQSEEYPEVDVGSIGTDSYGNAYSCKYNYSIKISNQVTINTYDKDNNLTNSNSLMPDEKTIAGTAIGVGIYEIKTVSWDIPKVTVTKTTGTTYTCISEKKICDCSGARVPLIASIKRFGPIIGDCVCNYIYLYNQQSCPSGYKIHRITNGTETTITNTDDEFYKKCLKQAEEETSKKAIKNMTPSLVIKLQDPNDINGKNTIEVRSNSCTSSGAKVSTCTYVYSVNKTCINVKTSKIRYIISGNEDCSSDEIEVKKDSNHWHYFTPLNAKGNDNEEFFISASVSGKNAKQSAKACQYVINNYSNYKELIIPSETSKYNQFTGNKSKDLAIANAGCYISSIVYIPLSQKFYGKEDNEIKGYNFYYRQIDSANPFPNGITTDSYWSDWYKSKNKNPDLTKSFDKVTYYTGIINTTNIRNYNKKYKYTSWEDMNASGLSNFINDSMRINVNKKDIYKLGCGPLNKDWSECKK